MRFSTIFLVLLDAVSLVKTNPLSRGKILLVDTRPSSGLSTNDSTKSPYSELKQITSMGECKPGSFRADAECSRKFYFCLDTEAYTPRSCSQGYVFDLSYKKCQKLQSVPKCQQQPMDTKTREPLGPAGNTAGPLKKTIIETVLKPFVPEAVVVSEPIPEPEIPPPPIYYTILPFFDAFNMPFPQRYLPRTASSFNTYGHNERIPDIFNKDGRHLKSPYVGTTNPFFSAAVPHPVFDQFMSPGFVDLRTPAVNSTNATNSIARINSLRQHPPMNPSVGLNPNGKDVSDLGDFLPADQTRNEDEEVPSKPSDDDGFLPKPVEDTAAKDLKKSGNAPDEPEKSDFSGNGLHEDNVKPADKSLDPPPIAAAKVPELSDGNQQFPPRKSYHTQDSLYAEKIGGQQDLKNVENQPANNGNLNASPDNHDYQKSPDPSKPLREMKQKQGGNGAVTNIEKHGVGPDMTDDPLAIPDQMQETEDEDNGISPEHPANYHEPDVFRPPYPREIENGFPDRINQVQEEKLQQDLLPSDLDQKAPERKEMDIEPPNDMHNPTSIEKAEKLLTSQNANKKKEKRSTTGIEKTGDCIIEDEGKALPSGRQCSLYYKCISSKWRTMMCSEGLFFDPQVQQCVPSSKVSPQDIGCRVM